MERHYDVLVIGGGIAGLTAARLFARAGLRTGLIEAQPRLGGAIHTAQFRDGFWLELGAHTLFNSYRSLLTLFPELQWQEILLRRRRLPYRLWRAGELRSVAGALHWGELAGHIPRALLLSRSGRSVADWFGAVVGPRNYAEVVAPALSALLCQPADDFPAALLLKRRRHAAEFPRNFSLRGGLAALAAGLAHGFERHTGEAARRLRLDGGLVRCQTDAAHYTAARLLLAVPADEAGRLLADLAPGAAEGLAAIPMQPICSTGLVVERNEVKVPPLAGIVGDHAPWFSVVSRDVIPDSAMRGFTFHFRAGLAPSERMALATRALGIAPEQVKAVAHAEHRLPGLRLMHQERLAQIERGISRLPVGVAGNYFGGLSIEDCVARAHRECNRLMHQENTHKQAT